MQPTMALVLRYTEKDGPDGTLCNIHGKQRPWRSRDVQCLDGIFEDDLDLGNCRGQNYDNASAMSGKYNGLQAKVRAKNSLAYWIHCTTHSLNLVWKNAVECCSNVVLFFLLP